MADVRFGLWSTTLLLGSMHAVVVSALLCRVAVNRSANRALAALLLTVALLVTPYTLGYAGLYDAYPDLTFAPFFWELALGPLIWLYVRQLSHRRMPRGWIWHLAPALVQGGYYAVLFSWPLADKWAWDERVHRVWISPLQDVAVLVSLTAYLAASWQQQMRYQRWLVQSSGAREELRLPWLWGFLIAASVIVLLRLGFTATDRGWRRLSYFDEFPRYVGLVLVVYYLGIEGWRHSRARYPAMDDAAQANGLAGPDDDLGDAAAHAIAPRGYDWANRGQEIAAQVSRSGWWQEPDLSLMRLARLLGTNSHYVSRALNEGLGMSFSAFVNGQRIAAAQARLVGDEDILAIALAVGFGSKASFNRVFRAQVGCTPSEYRQAVRLKS